MDLVPMAVKREASEAVVFTWISFPGRAELDAWTATMETEPRQKALMKCAAPSDTARMMWGTFEVVFEAT